MAKPDAKNPKTAVRVQSGDTLSTIAKANNLTLSEIKALNPNIMNDPKYNKGSKIFSNTKINIAPPKPTVSASNSSNSSDTGKDQSTDTTTQTSTTSSANLAVTPPAAIKTATPDIVLFDDSALPIELISDLIFENIGGQELISITRSDIVNGQKISYQPIKNLSLIQQQYNPNNILGLQQTANKFFAGFSIKLEDKIPEVGNGPNGENIYFDETTGDLIIEFINLNNDEQIETQITVNGTIYEANFGDYTS
jgi:LysM repeat protein